MAEQRTVAGLRCGEVLELLSAYLDGELEAERRAQIEEHVRGCDWCEQFGGAFSRVVGSLREELGAAPAAEPEVTARLGKRLGLD